MQGRVEELRWSALISSGSVNDARAVAEHEYQRALDERHDSERGIWAYYRGLGMIHEGRVRTAARWLGEAVPLLREQDSFRSVPCLAALGIAAALSGDRDTARRAVEQTESHPTSTLPVYLADIALARMWLAVADGQTATARDIGLDAVERLGPNVPRLEVLILHAVARLGAPAVVVERLEDLARRTDGAQYALCAAHARATLRDDGNELDRIAAGFNEAGSVLAAAEAAAVAALAHERAGLRARAAVSRRTATGYASRCEGASTPAIAALDRPRELTGREQEIANLALQGLSSREIAERTGVSVRTVDNHLYRLYTKLGISGRHDLSSVLQTAPSRAE